MKVAKINEFEYDLLTDGWIGPKGAAWNVCWEFCRKNGLLKSISPVHLPGESTGETFEVTDLGRRAIKKYETEDD